MFQSILQAEGSDLASTASSWGAVDTSFLTESQPDSVPLRATAVAFAGATDSDATSVPNQLAGQGEPLAASDPLTVFLGPWVSPDNSGDSVASDLGQFLGSVLPSAPALPVSQGGVAMPVTRTSVDGGGGPGEVSGLMALSGLKTIAWPTYQQNPLHTGRTPAHVDPAGLTLAWKAPTGFSVPLIVGQAVISMKNQQGIGNDSTSIRSFQLQTGEVNWDYTDKFVFPSQPTFSNNLVVFAAAASISSPFRLYVLNANDGSLRYTVQLSSSFDSSVMPTVARNRANGELMAFVATGGTLYAVNLEDTSGSVAWKQSGSFGGFSMPTMVGSSVVVAGPGHFYAFDMTTGSMNQFHSGNISGGGGTTVAYDAALSQFYVLEDYNDPSNTLTAYAYTDNANIAQIWQKTGPGLRSGSSVAIAPDDTLYSVDNTTILQIDPTDGSTIRSVGGQNIANLVTPALSDSDLWVIGPTQTLIYDLSSLTLARALPGSRGNLNSAYDSPGAITGRHFVLDYGNIYGSPGFDVYRDQLTLA
jgi:hypothetical protein